MPQGGKRGGGRERGVATIDSCTAAREVRILKGFFLMPRVEDVQLTIREPPPVLWWEVSRRVGTEGVSTWPNMVGFGSMVCQPKYPSPLVGQGC